MIGYRYGPGLAVILAIAGVGLVVNSLRGFVSREGMYDAESTQSMVWSNILGIVVGAAMALYGIAYVARMLDLFSF
jgi:hypothetical protein